jgi:hypothetical protein
MPRDGSAPTNEIETPAAGAAPLPEQDGLAKSLSPVDLPEPPEPQPHGLKWTTMVIVWASLVLALLNANAIRSWSYQLPPGAASARIVAAAEAWYATVDQVGFNRPVETMHGWWQAAKETRFHGAAGSRRLGFSGRPVPARRANRRRGATGPSDAGRLATQYRWGAPAALPLLPPRSPRTR